MRSENSGGDGVFFPTKLTSKAVERFRDVLAVPSDDSRILSYEQAAVYLGDLSRPTVEVLVAGGEIEAVDVTVGRRGIRLGELRRYADSRPVSEVSMRSAIR